uniref:MFS domain-containing protein n=1 Tax=Macrostomum lignano TaxID=282301 RepID=A0A1I8IRS1_9PLAT
TKSCRPERAANTEEAAPVSCARLSALRPTILLPPLPVCCCRCCCRCFAAGTGRSTRNSPPMWPLRRCPGDSLLCKPLPFSSEDAPDEGADSGRSVAHISQPGRRHLFLKVHTGQSQVRCGCSACHGGGSMATGTVAAGTAGLGSASSSAGGASGAAAGCGSPSTYSPPAIQHCRPGGRSRARAATRARSSPIRVSPRAIKRSSWRGRPRPSRATGRANQPSSSSDRRATTGDSSCCCGIASGGGAGRMSSWTRRSQSSRAWRAASSASPDLMAASRRAAADETAGHQSAATPLEAALGEASEPLASQLRLDVSKKAIVRRCQIRRVGRMLPLLESEAVDVRASEGCRVRPGIVAVQQDALAHDPTPLQAEIAALCCKQTSYRRFFCSAVSSLGTHRETSFDRPRCSCRIWKTEPHEISAALANSSIVMWPFSLTSSSIRMALLSLTAVAGRPERGLSCTLISPSFLFRTQFATVARQQASSPKRLTNLWWIVFTDMPSSAKAKTIRRCETLSPYALAILKPSELSTNKVRQTPATMALEQILLVLTVSIIAVCVIIGWALAAVFVRILYSSPGADSAISLRRGVFTLPRSNYRPPPALLRLRKPASGDDATLEQRSKDNQQVNWCNHRLPYWPLGQDWHRLESQVNSRLQVLRDSTTVSINSNCNTNNTCIDSVGLSSGLPSEPEAILLQYTFLYDMSPAYPAVARSHANAQLDVEAGRNWASLSPCGIETGNSANQFASLALQSSASAASRVGAMAPVHMEYEEVLEHIGSLGRYQIVLFNLLASLSWKAAANMVITVFHVVRPAFVCQQAYPNWLESPPTWAQIANASATGGQDSQCWFTPPRNGTSGEQQQQQCTLFAYDKSEWKETITTQWDLVCQRQGLEPLVFGSYALGYGFGVVLGIFADKFGRRPVLLVSCAMEALFTLLESVSPNFLSYLGLHFAHGIFATVNLLSTVCITEFVGCKHRALVANLLWLYYCLGYMSVAGMAYLESPRWLIAHGRYTDALYVCENIARVNGRTIPTAAKELLTYGFQTSQPPEHSREGNVSEMFRTRIMLKKSLILFCACISLDSDFLASDVFINTVLSGLIEVPAYVTAWIVAEKVGRRIPIAVLYTMLSACLISVAVLTPGSVSHTVLALLAKLSATCAFSIITNYTAEVYPTSIRNTGIFFCSAIGRISSLLAPFILAVNSGGSYGARMAAPIAFACLGILAGAALYYLPETKGIPLPQTVREANIITPGKEPAFISLVQKRRQEIAVYFVGRGESATVSFGNSVADAASQQQTAAAAQDQQPVQIRLEGVAANAETATEDLPDAKAAETVNSSQPASEEDVQVGFGTNNYLIDPYDG